MNSDVLIYTSPICPKCSALKQKMSSKGISFKETEDYTGLEGSGFFGLPVLQVDGKLMDFSAAWNWVNTK